MASLGAQKKSQYFPEALCAIPLPDIRTSLDEPRGDFTGIVHVNCQADSVAGYVNFRGTHFAQGIGLR
jgi:hypothetical protein